MGDHFAASIGMKSKLIAILKRGIAMAAVSAYFRLSPAETNNTTDDTYPFTKRITVQIVELDMAIIIGCVPIFPGLLRETIVTAWFSRAFSSMSRLVRTRGTSKSSTKTDRYYNLGGQEQTNSQVSTAPIPLKPVPSDDKNGTGTQVRTDVHSESMV